MQMGWSGSQRAVPRGDVKLDALDKQIIWELCRDGRIPNKALADKLHVSPSTTLTRIRALKNGGVLESAHAKVHLTSVGLCVEALVFVSLLPQAGKEIQRFAKDAVVMSSTVNVFVVGGDQAVIIHVACTSTEQLRDFVIAVSMDPVVASTQTQIVFERLDALQHMDQFEGFDDLRKPIKAGFARPQT